MRYLLLLLFLLAAVPAQAQAPGILPAIQDLLGNHLGVGVAAHYDWVADGDKKAPYAVGPVGAWKVNDALLISGGARYVLNQGTWRSELSVMVPLYNGKFLGVGTP